MKFEAELDYVSGYLRTGRLVGSFTQEEYAEWLILDVTQQKEMLWEYGAVQVTDYSIEECGGLSDIKFSPAQPGEQ